MSPIAHDHIPLHTIAHNRTHTYTSSHAITHNHTVTQAHYHTCKIVHTNGRTCMHIYQAEAAGLRRRDEQRTADFNERIAAADASRKELEVCRHNFFMNPNPPASPSATAASPPDCCPLSTAHSLAAPLSTAYSLFGSALPPEESTLADSLQKKKNK